MLRHLYSTPPQQYVSTRLSVPLDLIQSRSGRGLRPRPLPSDRQPHCMPPPPVGPHISQPLYIIPQFSLQIIFNIHGGEFGVEVEDLFVD